MRVTTLAMAVVTTMAMGHAAEARTHHRPYTYHRVARSYVMAHHRWARRDGQRSFGDTQYVFSGSQGGGGYGPRPAEWCGWEMRHLVSSDPGVAFNRAAEWAHWGHGGPAGVGAIVVWPHHVGKIVGQENGVWVIESGNDGHALRTRPRSLAGAIAFRWS